MKPAILDRGAPWPVDLVVIATLAISAIRGLGAPPFGPVPALARFDWVKFVDPGLVVALGAFGLVNALARGTRFVPAWKAWWSGCAAIVLVLGTISGLYWSVAAYDAAQSILFLLRPAALLLIFTAFPWDRRSSLAPRAVVAFAILNIGVVLRAWLAARATGPGYSADAILGLFHDAHQQATFSYSVALVAVACAAGATTGRDRLAWIAFIAANALAGFVSQAQKSTGLEIAVFLGALAILVLRSRARLLRLVQLAPAAALTVLLALTVASGTTIWTSAAELVTGNLQQRLEEGGYRGLAFVEDLGAVRMARDFTWLSARTPETLVVGAGPANYGSPAALRRVEQGHASALIRELFWWEAAKESELVNAGELRLLGLSAKTSLPGIVLGELGCLALLAFLPLLVGPLTILARLDLGADERRRLFWLKTAYVGVIAQSVVNTLGAWDNDVVLTLLFAGFAGMVAVRGPREPA